MKFKKLATFILSTVMCLSVVGCGGNASTKSSEKENKDEIVYASTKDIRDINPHLYSGEMAAQNMVFESLVINTKDGVKPYLAKSWDISEDGLQYTFHLRDDVTFTDGEKFNAEAVKLNMDAIIANHERHAWLDMINEIDSNEVVDEYTYKLKLKHPYYPTLEELGLTRPFRFISPKCFVNGETKDGVSAYVGTGPWILSEHKDDQYAIFKVNEKYWGEKPKTKSVKWKVMPDHQTMLLALQKGEIDLIFGSDGDMIDLDSFKALEEEGKYKTELSNPVASRAILLNAHQPITSDIKVRQAFQYAIDKQAISDGVLNGSEAVADTLLSSTVPYCDIELERHSYDKEKAGKLLDEAGWKMGKDNYRYKDGKKCEVTIYFNSDNAQERTISEYMQNDLKSVGVSLKIVGEEKQAFLDRQKSGEFDLQYSLSWGTPYDPQSYLSSWRIPAHGDYQAQIGMDKKKWLDETITKLMIEPNENTRKEMYKEVLTYIHEQGVYIPLTYSRTKAVHVPQLEGVDFNVSQYEIPFEKMYFKK
ncbi:nickel ABC transporter, nickel/metallophore periplasmic binding protein [Romboutsia maritimum]|uniref:Nickel ABC transporter, nickel/metallophore periplasmic binding protein n=1 Tax=Romboutsia maritimum TaxID=2020948 RepID=A0A371IUL0_9FIRM|nr:nickel ABC transporter substrate-binding protein [Romboutsia maritimum]RDY24163.1 nickel ABC transporter, nickel/metallophore periplasmic binding protein [Romboutsia maritimum]